MKYHIVDVNTSTQLKNQLIKYAKNCSFQGTGSYLAELLFYNECEDYEKIFAVISDNQVIGFAALLKKCSCIDDESHAPWLDFLFVDEKYRNQHIGSALIDTVCCYSKKLGFDDIFLCTVSHKDFYEKTGFLTKYTTLYYNNQQNDGPIFVMQKNMTEQTER